MAAIRAGARTTSSVIALCQRRLQTTLVATEAPLRSASRRLLAVLLGGRGIVSRKGDIHRDRGAQAHQSVHVAALFGRAEEALRRFEDDVRLPGDVNRLVSAQR